MDGILEWKEDGKPAEHARRVSGRIDGQHHVFVEDRFEVAGESVQHRVAFDGEIAHRVARIINRLIYNFSPIKCFIINFFLRWKNGNRPRLGWIKVKRACGSANSVRLRKWTTYDISNEV